MHLVANTICFGAAQSLSLSICQLHPLGIFVFKFYNKFVTRIWGNEVVGFSFFEKFWPQGWIISCVWEHTHCPFIPKLNERKRQISPSGFFSPLRTLPPLCPHPQVSTLARSLEVAKVRLWSSTCSAEIHWNVCQWHICHWIINITELLLISLWFEPNSLSSPCLPVLISRNIWLNFQTYLSHCRVLGLLCRVSLF